jgi:ribosome-associated translation inhibitor RaiA
VDKAFDYLERMLKKLHERMEKLEEKHGRKPETAL